MNKPTIHDLVKILSRETGLPSREILDILRTPLHPRELRDEFAGQAMAALIVAPQDEWPENEQRGSVSLMAYEIAGAMLKAREVQS